MVQGATSSKSNTQHQSVPPQKGTQILEKPRPRIDPLLIELIALLLTACPLLLLFWIPLLSITMKLSTPTSDSTQPPTGDPLGAGLMLATFDEDDDLGAVSYTHLTLPTIYSV